MTEQQTLASDDAEAQAMESPDEFQEHEEQDDGPPKKKRRTAKPNSEKKFECKHLNCGKSYSRAEHLYRHQLNHTPKTIYRCDFPGCNRYFVRQDLCVRHRERHTTNGSQLHKRDSFAQNSRQVEETNTTTISATDSPKMQSLELGLSEQLPQNTQLTTTIPNARLEEGSNSIQAADTRPALSGSATTPSASLNDHRFQPPTPRSGMSKPAYSLHRNHSSGNNQFNPEQRRPLTRWQSAGKDGFTSASTPPRPMYAMPGSNNDGTNHTVPQPPGRTYSNSSTSTINMTRLKSSSDMYIDAANTDNGYLQQGDVSSINYSHDFQTPSLSRPPSEAFVTAVSQGLSGTRTEPFAYSSLSNGDSAIDMSAAYGYPIFGGDEYGRSPFALADDFTAWLFNDGQSGPTGFSPNTLMGAYGENPVSQMHGPFFSQSPTNSITFQNSLMMGRPMSVNSLLDQPSASGYIMSEDKRQALLDIMQTQFIERPQDAVKKHKDSLFEGNIDADGHVLSLRMMHTYIGSYWYHQHAQLPILHKPTFSADKTPNLLLLAVVAIGAATLDKAYGTCLTDAAAEFANFVAWHIRWEIIRDADFRPPAKLWVFQTLLLIEVYEKMYATRALHERAHIHHDSTLTLMRRGSSLIGRSPSDSPPNGQEGGSRHESRSIEPQAPLETSKSEESWARWITTEATRRSAFAAFVIDSIHCTMFGHSAKMVAHEMRLPLPCDEALWSATTPAEVGRVQASLQVNGVKPIMFLDALKKTLSGQRVRTNSFGRTVVMSGLLSVSWHMAQRDLQISSLGSRTASSFGGPDKWKGVLLRAFDNWKRDFDEALAEATLTPSSPARSNGPSMHSLLRPVDEENIFESRTVLHHLAHIAAHVDIVDCQVFAGANRLLSRSVTPKDYNVIRGKIERWATKASARDSAFYALKFLTQVLIPPDNSRAIDGRSYGHASPILPQAFEHDTYMARDDFLLNRPWVLYISALVVWCYGYALEGPIIPTPREDDFRTHEQREKDMRAYLDRVASVRAPDDLENVPGKNRCLGLLLTLQESFASTRWELTHEAAGLLGNAAMKLRGITDSDSGFNRGKWPPPKQKRHTAPDQSSMSRTASYMRDGSTPLATNANYRSNSAMHSL